MSRANRSSTVLYESLENRRLMAVTVNTYQDNMRVFGVAEGPVEVVAVAADTYRVSENGVEIGTYSGIKENLRIDLDQSGQATKDQVRVDMMDQWIRHVVINVGDGDDFVKVSGRPRFDGTKTFAVYAGAGKDTVETDNWVRDWHTVDLGDGDDTFLHEKFAGAKLRLFGGNGNDRVTIAPDSGFSKGFFMSLGGGNDSVEIAKLHGYAAQINAGVGDDAISILDAQIGADVNFDLGNGNNTLIAKGSYFGNFRVQGGYGSDIVNISNAQFVANQLNPSMSILLGSGNNSLTMQSTSLGMDLLFRAEDGDDTVYLGEDLLASKNVRIVLGSGENELLSESSIGGDLVAVSRNRNDNLLSEGQVGGRTFLGPGAQRS